MTKDNKVDRMFVTEQERATLALVRNIDDGALHEYFVSDVERIYTEEVTQAERELLEAFRKYGCFEEIKINQGAPLSAVVRHAARNVERLEFSSTGN